MSDRETRNRRKLLLLIVPILLLLGWFAFAPGNDQKNADNKDTKTSQKQTANKDNEDKAEGQVASVATTEPSTASTNTTPTSNWKPSPNVKVASVVTGTPQQHPAPHDSQTPPVESEEPDCDIYDGQVITLQPGESSDCYILANENEALGCWIPALPYAFANDPDQLFWVGEILLPELPWEEIPFPYLVVENKSALEVDGLPEGLPLEEFCPAYDNYLQFHVRVPEWAASSQPGTEYDYVLPVMNVAFDLDDLLNSFDGPMEGDYPEVDFTCHDVLVNVTGEEPEEPLWWGDELNCDTLLNALPPVVGVPELR